MRPLRPAVSFGGSSNAFIIWGIHRVRLNHGGHREAQRIEFLLSVVCGQKRPAFHLGLRHFAFAHPPFPASVRLTSKNLMKKKIAALVLAAAALLSNACEQHKWSETKQLYPEEKTGEAEHSEHKAEAGKEASHEAKPAEGKKE